MNLGEINLMLTPSQLLLLGVGLQFASALVWWLCAEIRTGRAGMQMVSPPLLRAIDSPPANAMPHPVAQAAPHARRHTRQSRNGSAMIERDAA